MMKQQGNAVGWISDEFETGLGEFRIRNKHRMADLEEEGAD
jgi:hypothetical protein